MSIDYERVRARAYQIWEHEGRPQGRHEGHWMQALQELAEAEPVEAVASPGPAAPVPDPTTNQDRAAETAPAGAVPPAHGIATDGDSASSAGELVLPAAAPLIGGGSRVPSLPQDKVKPVSKAAGSAKSVATQRTAKRSQAATKSATAARPVARVDTSPADPAATAKPRRSVRKPRGE